MYITVSATENFCNDMQSENMTHRKRHNLLLLLLLSIVANELHPNNSDNCF